MLRWPLVSAPMLACLVACGADAGPAATSKRPQAPSQPTVPSASAPVAAPVAPAPNPALEARLAKEALSGFAALTERAVLYPTAAAARKGGRDFAGFHRDRNYQMFRNGLRATLDNQRYVRIVDDQQDVVRVSTRLEGGLLSPDWRFELEAFVSRTALRPVLRKSIARFSADHTGFALYAGLPVSMTKPVAPLGLPFDVEADIREVDVGLSFSAAEIDVPELAAHLLGCARGDAKDRVEKESVLRSESAAVSEDLLDAKMGNVWPCRLERDTPLTLDGRALEVSTALGSRVCSDQVKVWDISGRTLVQVELAHASLRATVPRDRLRRRGNCASPMGRLAKPKTEWVVRGTKPAVWRDGAPAGHHHGRETILSRAREVDGRICAPYGYLSSPLCFDKTSVVERERKFSR